MTDGDYYDDSIDEWVKGSELFHASIGVNGDKFYADVTADFGELFPVGPKDSVGELLADLFMAVLDMESFRDRADDIRRDFLDRFDVDDLLDGDEPREV